MIPQAEGDLTALGDIPRYLIEVEIDWENPSFSGKETIVFTNTEGVPLKEIYLRLYPNGNLLFGEGSLSVSRIAVDGQAVGFEEEIGSSALLVPLAESLQLGETVKLEIAFSGIVPEDDLAYGIYNFSRDIMVLADWYPVLAVYDENGWNLDPVRSWGDAVYSEVAFYEVTVNVPSGLEIMATGVSVAEEETDGETTITLVSGPAREFTVVVSPALKHLSRRVGETLVNAHYLGSESTGQFLLQHAADSLEVFNDLFGTYPYRELDILEVPMETGGMEYPGLILIDEESVFSARVVAHEVAHQWWYGVVGNDVLEEPWLDEALATFASLLYAQEVFGEATYEEWFDVYRGRYNDAREVVPTRLVTDPVSTFTGGVGYFGIVYARGAMFYDALRDLIGEEALLQALRDYYADFMYQIATADDLLRSLENASNHNLGAFFREWLYTP